MLGIVSRAAAYVGKTIFWGGTATAAVYYGAPAALDTVNKKLNDSANLQNWQDLNHPYLEKSVSIKGVVYQGGKDYLLVPTGESSKGTVLAQLMPAVGVNRDIRLDIDGNLVDKSVSGLATVDTGMGKAEFDQKSRLRQQEVNDERQKHLDMNPLEKARLKAGLGPVAKPEKSTADTTKEVIGILTPILGIGFGILAMAVTNFSLTGILLGLLAGGAALFHKQIGEFASGTTEPQPTAVAANTPANDEKKNDNAKAAAKAVSAEPKSVAPAVTKPEPSPGLLPKPAQTPKAAAPMGAKPSVSPPAH